MNSNNTPNSCPHTDHEQARIQVQSTQKGNVIAILIIETGKNQTSSVNDIAHGKGKAAFDEENAFMQAVAEQKQNMQ